MSCRNQLIDFNGVNPETGAPMIQPMSVTEVAHPIKAQTFDRLAAAAAKRRELDSQPELDVLETRTPTRSAAPKAGAGVLCS